MGIPATKVSKVRMTGPLAPFAPVFTAKLKELGYTPLTIASELRMVADWSRWLQERSLSAADVTSERADQFVVARRSAGRISPYPPRVFNTITEILVEQGVIQAENKAPVPGSSIDVLLGSFKKFLLTERGLAQCTSAAYVLRARRFLDQQAPTGTLSELKTKDVTDAVRAEATTVSVGSTQFFVVAVRSFLRFCFIEGLIPTDLSGAALAITGRRRSPLAKGISSADARRLLDSCDRRGGDGRRDYAILLILLRLGLRANEIAALSLEDIDWRAGLILVHGKGRRDDRLPLPVDVGQAISGYLQRGRPRTLHREVFFRSLAPREALGRGGVSLVVRRACRRAGLAPVGSHRLRHTLACEMVNSGVPLPEIAQVLRHRSLESTALYARMDIDGLRALARPWPGGDR